MELSSQLSTFVITIATGMLLGVLFDCYRVLRGTVKPKTVITWFTDLLYWLVATLVVFVALLASNWGELRFYVFIGIVSGLIFYYNWLSLYAIRLFISTIRFINIVNNFLIRIFVSVVLKPIACCTRMVSWPIIFTCRKVRHWYHIRWPKIPDEEEK